MTRSSTEAVVQDSIRYLSSDEALRSIDANPYWPKWHSPWWHMVALHEMGQAASIPKSTVRHLVGAIQEQYPQDGSPASTMPCPCELGNIIQVLSGAGVNIDHEMGWVWRWFLDRQMPDGGLSCDDDAYHAQPPASSIVGTIAPLEALLLSTNRALTQKEERFLDLGAHCLIERKLMLGCTAPFNAEECLDESDWIKPCFPRFYLYDVLRGLSFILKWTEKRRKSVPLSAIEGVVSVLKEKFPDGRILIERHSFEGIGTRVRAVSGEWTRSPTASFFPLLNGLSGMGQVSPYLTQQWHEAKERIAALTKEGLIT